MSEERRVGKHERRINHPAPAEVAEGAPDDLVVRNPAPNAAESSAALNYATYGNAPRIRSRTGQKSQWTLGYEAGQAALRAAPSLPKKGKS